MTQWISVEDRISQVGERVIIFGYASDNFETLDHYDHLVCIAEWTDEDFISQNIFGKAPTHLDVTHWMQLPEIMVES